MSVLTLTNNNFQKEALESDVPVIIDFWATWCGPCKMMSPVIDEIAEENPQIKVCKINVDEEQELAIRYNIMSIPTILVIKDGKVSSTMVGVRPKSEILSAI